MRSAVFAIQKCYWNSACECTTFIKTTSTAIFTEREVVLFMSRAFAMLHECKRLLNKKTPCRGILFVRDPGDAPMPLDAALRVASADSEADVAQRPPELGSEGAEQEVPAGDEPDESALPAGGLFNPAEDGETDINSDMGACYQFSQQRDSRYSPSIVSNSLISSNMLRRLYRLVNRISNWLTRFSTRST